PKKKVAGKSLEPPPGLLNDQRARRGVPWAKLQLPESIYATASHIAEIQSRRAIAPNSLRPSHKCLEEAEIILCVFALVIGKTGGEESFIQFAHAGNPYGISIQCRAAAFDSSEALASQWIVN